MFIPPIFGETRAPRCHKGGALRFNSFRASNYRTSISERHLVRPHQLLVIPIENISQACTRPWRSAKPNLKVELVAFTEDLLEVLGEIVPAILGYTKESLGYKKKSG